MKTKNNHLHHDIRLFMDGLIGLTTGVTEVHVPPDPNIRFSLDFFLKNRIFLLDISCDICSFFLYASDKENKIGAFHLNDKSLRHFQENRKCDSNNKLQKYISLCQNCILHQKNKVTGNFELFAASFFSSNEFIDFC